MSSKVICWWSGGVTSAVACKVAIELFGVDNCRVIMIDTCNEDDDTYRFRSDCEEWYGCRIETITAIGEKWKSIQDVWMTRKSLNSATGAICSTELKRVVREKWQKQNAFKHQVFGFEFDSKEFNRAKALTLNHPDAKAIYPLLMFGLTKEDCIDIISVHGIVIPNAYTLGFRNNNCLKTGCVQGGVGYWQKMKRDSPDKFNAMADMEHELTRSKGVPVTMLKDQSKEAKLKSKDDKTKAFVFLRKHPSYPDLKSIDEMPECKVEPLFECNGMCGTNDLIERKESENQINFTE